MLKLFKGIDWERLIGAAFIVFLGFALLSVVAFFGWALVGIGGALFALATFVMFCMLTMLVYNENK